MIINNVTYVTSLFLFIVSIYFIYIVLYVKYYIICNTHVIMYSINSGILLVTEVTKLIIKALSVTSCNLSKNNSLIINKKL